MRGQYATVGRFSELHLGFDHDGAVAVGGDMARPDAGALYDPFVRGGDPRRKLGIGQNLPRQIGTAAEHDRAYCSHETASCAVCAWPSAPPWRLSIWLILVRRS